MENAFLQYKQIVKQFSHCKPSISMEGFLILNFYLAFVRLTKQSHSGNLQLIWFKHLYIPKSNTIRHYPLKPPSVGAFSLHKTKLS